MGRENGVERVEEWWGVGGGKRYENEKEEHQVTTRSRSHEGGWGSQQENSVTGPLDA